MKSPSSKTLFLVLALAGALAGAPETAHALLFGSNPANPGDTVFPGVIPAGTDPGTLLATLSAPFTSSLGTTSGTLVSAVYRESVGTLDFYYQIVVNTTSTNCGGSGQPGCDPVARETASAFRGFSTALGFRVDGASLPGGVFVNGSATAMTADRNAGGDVVGFSFQPPDSSKILPGQASTVLVISTNATGFAAGNASVIDGGVTTVASFEPAGPAGTVQPSPATSSATRKVGSGLIPLPGRVLIGTVSTNPGDTVFPGLIPGATDPGTLLAALTAPFTSSLGTTSGTLVSAVYRESVGTLDFYYQIVVNTTSTNCGGSGQPGCDPIARETSTAFPGFTTALGLRVDGASLPGGVFVNGSVAPVTADRNAVGDVVGFSFSPPDSSKILPGKTSTVLVISTNATGFAAGNASVIDGGVTTVASFEPALTAGTGAISGQKFDDLNQNGAKDAGEPGLAGWTIQLDQSADGTVDATAVTDAGGNYGFLNLAPGTYRLREVVQPGWVQTTTNPPDVVLTAGTFVTTVDFGNRRLSVAEIPTLQTLGLVALAALVVASALAWLRARRKRGSAFRPW